MTRASKAGDLTRRLAREAAAVCRRYLPNGRREQGAWRVGDVGNNRGRSLCIRLAGPETGPGAAGRWIDFATGEHGDLLDLIAAVQGCDLASAMAEAERFLGLWPSEQHTEPAQSAHDRAVPLSREASLAAARRLFADARPIAGTVAEIHLRIRSIVVPDGTMPLRFHPACRLRLEGHPDQYWPALLAAVTDLAGDITGLHRTYLARDGTAKAPVDEPRRALGALHGHAVRFGAATNLLAAGEGIETVLSLRSLLPELPVAATLAASHLGALILPAGLQRLLIAVDRDRAGWQAAGRLQERAEAAGIAVARLIPTLGDWNDDLRQLGRAATRERLIVQAG